MITMLGLFIVVTYVEQRLIVYQIQPGKRSFMAPTLVLFENARSSNIIKLTYSLFILSKLVSFK